jgi:hypothetical protein
MDPGVDDGAGAQEWRRTGGAAGGRVSLGASGGRLVGSPCRGGIGPGQRGLERLFRSLGAIRAHRAARSHGARRWRFGAGVTGGHA